MSKVIEKAKAVLANNGLEACYATSDGVIFIEKHHADSHAQRFPTGKNKVETFTALELLENAEARIKALNKATKDDEDLEALGFEYLKTLATETYQLDITGLNSKDKLRAAILETKAKDLEVNTEE